jgi:hypothetical protein
MVDIGNLQSPTNSSLHQTSIDSNMPSLIPPRPPSPHIKYSNNESTIISSEASREIFKQIVLKLSLTGFKSIKIVPVTIFSPPDMDYILSAACQSFRLPPASAIDLVLYLEKTKIDVGQRFLNATSNATGNQSTDGAKNTLPDDKILKKYRVKDINDIINASNEATEFYSSENDLLNINFDVKPNENKPIPVLSFVMTLAESFVIRLFVLPEVTDIETNLSSYNTYNDMKWFKSSKIIQNFLNEAQKDENIGVVVAIDPFMDEMTFLDTCRYAADSLLPNDFEVEKVKVFQTDGVEVFSPLTVRNGDILFLCPLAFVDSNDENLNPNSENGAIVNAYPSFQVAPTDNNVTPSKPLDHVDHFSDNNIVISNSPAATEYRDQYLTQFQQNVINYGSNVGLNVTPSVAAFLEGRCSSIEAAIDYYLENRELCEQKAGSMKTASNTNSQNYHGPTMKTQINSSTGYVQEEIELSRLTPFQREIITELSKIGVTLSANQAISLSRRCSSAEAALQYYTSHDNSFHLDDRNTAMDVNDISTTVSSKPSSFKQDEIELTDFQREILNIFTGMGLILTPKQAIELSRRCSSKEAAIEYFFLNPELFQTEDVGPTNSSSGTNYSSSLLGTNKGISPDIQFPSAPPINEYAQVPDSTHASYFSGRDDIEKDCLICQDRFPVEDMFTVDCSSSHRFCYDCLSGYVRLQILGDNETQRHIPACPLANGQTGCNHLLSEKEIEQLATLALSLNIFDAMTMNSIIQGVRLLYKVIIALYSFPQYCH